MIRGGISLLIATYNGSERLFNTLKAIADLSIDGLPFVELIIVDNASTDRTAEKANEFWESLKTEFPIRVLSEKNPGKIHALQTGLKAIESEYVLICDDDNQLFPDYLKTGLYFMEQNPSIGIIGGQGILEPSLKKPDWFDAFAYSYACAPQAPHTGNVSPHRNVVYGAGMMIRKEAYDTALKLGFQFIMSNRKGESLSGGGEDGELCWAIKMLGYEIWYVENMKFYHLIPVMRLTDDFQRKLKKGMTKNGPYANAYIRVWKNEIPEKLSNFWFKEAVYSFKYIILLTFKKNGLSDFQRAKNVLIGLLKENKQYDQKIKGIREYYAKCKQKNIQL